MASSDSLSNIISAGDIIIPIMGITGSGKSTFIARCTGNETGIGHKLQSHTSEVLIQSFKYKGHTVRLVDTPGFDDSRSEFDDAQILNQIAGWLMLASKHSPPLTLNGIIYLHPINEAGGRMRGTAKNNLNMFQAMCGDEPMSSVVIVTTMWSKVKEGTGLDLQKQLSERYWNSMIDAGSKVVKHDDTSASALRIIEHIIDRKAQVKMGLQTQLVEGGMKLEETSAGQQLRSKVIEEQNRARNKLQDAQQDLEQALRDRDNTTANEILELQAKHDAMIRAKEDELNSMKRRADDLYQRTLESLAAAEKENARLQKEAEENVAAIKKQIEVANRQQLERYNPPPPSYSSYSGYSGASLGRRDPVAEMQLQLQEKQREAELRRQDVQMQTFFHYASMDIAKQQLDEAKRSAKWGKAGAVMSTVGAVAAVMSCNVM
ncbi:hypothetical protein yc1106_04360 [Curvularia clavata]|uniref:G domain-containing protein n=1 Tax=Curvularia clavata TaxID=95742 RepID=A0A9Q8Z797_CURCL|nr:hypothetical protein yc1106_04360 [Curvularia clavata]